MVVVVLVVIRGHLDEHTHPRDNKQYTKTLAANPFKWSHKVGKYTYAPSRLSGLSALIAHKQDVYLRNALQRPTARDACTLQGRAREMIAPTRPFAVLC